MDSNFINIRADSGYWVTMDETAYSASEMDDLRYHFRKNQKQELQMDSEVRHNVHSGILVSVLRKPKYCSSPAP